MWQYLTPQLPVTDVRRAQDYYRDILGFEICWIYGDDYGAVGRDGIEIHFFKTDNPDPCCCYVGVDDADELYALYQQQGAEIVAPIESKPWGMREFTIRDLNGHRFSIGHIEKKAAEIPAFQLGASSSTL